MLQFCKLVRQHNESSGEWKGRLRIAAIECNYKEVDRQLKEQFIHGLNYSDKLAKIIRELAKIDENTMITSEQALVWAKRIQAHITQLAVINSLSEVKNYDVI